jgi:hypothetical protein
MLLTALFNRTAPGGKEPLAVVARASVTHLFFESIHPIWAIVPKRVCSSGFVHASTRSGVSPLGAEGWKREICAEPVIRLDVPK